MNGLDGTLAFRHWESWEVGALYVSSALTSRSRRTVEDYRRSRRTIEIELQKTVEDVEDCRKSKRQPTPDCCVEMSPTSNKNIKKISFLRKGGFSR